MSGYGKNRSGYSRRGQDNELRPLEVIVDNGNVDRAIRILKRRMADAGVLRELKKRRYYEKPSERMKRKQREALRRHRKSMRQHRDS